MNASQNLRNCWYGSPRISCHPQIIIYWMNFLIGEFEGVSPVSPVNSEENFHLLYSYISQLLLITCKLFCPLFFSSLLSSPASLWGLGVSPQSLRPRRCSSPWRWSLRHRWGCANTWPPIILGLWSSPWHGLQMDRAVVLEKTLWRPERYFQDSRRLCTFYLVYCTAQHFRSSMCSVFWWLTALTKTLAVYEKPWCSSKYETSKKLMVSISKHLCFSSTAKLLSVIFKNLAPGSAFPIRVAPHCPGLGWALPLAGRALTEPISAKPRPRKPLRYKGTSKLRGKTEEIMTSLFFWRIVHQT